MAHRAVEALRQNCRVIVGDSPGRVRDVSKVKPVTVLRVLLPFRSHDLSLVLTLFFFESLLFGSFFSPGDLRF